MNQINNGRSQSLHYQRTYDNKTNENLDNKLWCPILIYELLNISLKYYSKKFFERILSDTTENVIETSKVIYS